MHQPPPTQPPEEPRPAGELLDVTFKLYRSAFQPLVLTAGVGALLANLLAVAYAPENQAVVFLWTLFVLAISIAVQSAVLLLASRAREGKPLTVEAVVAAIIAFGPRYFAATFLVTFVAGFFFLTILGIPLAVFIFVRCSLFGPAIVLENQSIALALVRSWRLVEGRWWRTFALQLLVGLMAVAPFALMSLILIPIDHVVAEVLLGTIASAVAIPLVACFSLLLFEDYRRLTDGQVSDAPGTPDAP